MSHFTDLDGTIAAIASPPGAGGRGIVRLSGPECLTLVDRTFEPAPPAAISPKSARRYVGIVQLRSLPLRQPLSVPADLYLWPTCRSYTRQPMAEFHLLGSPPLLEMVLSELLQHGARPAEPGEFTLRAFLGGRIDLVQAEAVLEVVDAGSPAALTAALSQLAGGISQPMLELREGLLLHLADLEAGLDFVEEDIDFLARDELIRRLQQAESLLSALLAQSHERMQTTGRRTVVLAGLPNAGKSTLFNELLGRPAALVSDQAGTTRDFLWAPLDWGGLELNLLDTAGWEQGVEGLQAQIDSQRSEQLQRADLIVWCTPADLPLHQIPLNVQARDNWRSRNIPLLEIVTKCDTLPADAPGPMPPLLTISCVNGAGIDELRTAIIDRFEQIGDKQGLLLANTAARCRDSLERALAAAHQARRLAEQQAGDELIACELREILDQLGRIVGAVYTDDLLDRIFSRFCIGK